MYVSSNVDQELSDSVVTPVKDMLKLGNLAGATGIPGEVGEGVSLIGSGVMVGTGPDISVVASGGRGVLPPWLMTVTGTAIRSERVTRIFMALECL
jgi:hypothetical protein